jgi:hypothetical protein
VSRAQCHVAYMTGHYMFGQFAFEGVAVDEPEVGLELDVVEGVFVVVVLVAA